MMATSFEKIEGAKASSKDFRRKLCEYLEDCEEKDAVFNLAISLSPCSQVQTRIDEEERKCLS